jgi:hypothetical protein
MFAASKTSSPASEANYIESVFSTYLYTGNGSTQTITNGIDLSTKGGLVWVKSRSAGYLNHVLFDTVRGNTKRLYSNLTDAEDTTTTSITSFNSNGFSIGSNALVNESASTFASWAFREQPKFFDVVTYTGDGVAGRTVAHNLGSTPGCMIVKRTDSTSNWAVYHRSTGATDVLLLNSTDPTGAVPSFWNNTAPTSTNFTLGNNATVNLNGATYVAYLFAHDAGGFGLTGTDNVISCGSYTGNGSTTGPIINLGWEPQWILLKPSTVTDNWNMYDNMRGATVSGSATLYANTTNAEGAIAANVAINATGFQPISTNSGVNGNGQTYIYIAIRRGPMKTPTTGTSVFSPIVATSSTGTDNTTGFPLDMQIANIRSGYASNGVVPSRLTGVSSNTTSSGSYLRTPSTSAETTGSDITRYWGNTGFQTASNWSGSGMVYWNFRRAPSVFDVVCYTGDGTTNRAVAHNLTVAPELIIVKARSAANYWWMVYAAPLGPNKYLALQATFASGTNSAFPLAQTATNFYVSATGSDVNVSSVTFVAYLFATCAGVSKVFSFTGSGSLQTINCGFAAGARFVLIKRTDSTGDWYVWDSARGISSSTDPYLLLNSTAAEVTSTNWVDTTSTGFQVTAASGNNVNINGATYIGLAIA